MIGIAGLNFYLYCKLIPAVKKKAESSVKRGILMLLFLVKVVVAHTQDYQRDAVLKELAEIRKQTLDTAQVIKIRQLGHSLIEKDSALAKTLITEALNKSLLLKEINTITDCYRLMGIWHHSYGHLDQAMIYYRQSYQSAEKNNNLYLMGGVLYNMGNVKYLRGEYDSCIYYYQQSQRIFEDPDFISKANIKQNLLDVRLSELYSNLATVFSSIRNLKKADEYIDKAIVITQKYKSRLAEQNLAGFMLQKANHHFENGEVDAALRIRLAYLPTLEKADFKYLLMDAWSAIVTEYLALEKIDSAALYAAKYSVQANALDIDNFKAESEVIMGDIAFRKAQHSTAWQHLQKARAFFDESKDPHERQRFFGLLKQVAYANGKFKDAYEYFSIYDVAKDSLQLGERAKVFSEMELRYETEKKEAQLKLQTALLRQKNILNYLLMSGSLALLLIFILSYRNYKVRQKLQQHRIAELETEKQLAATEAVLKGEEQERARLAKDLHDGLGGMLSGTKHSFTNMKENLIMTPENAQAFERGIDLLDKSIKEMRRVAHNMMPEILIQFGLDTALKELCLEINRNGSMNATYQSVEVEGVQLEQNLSVTTYRVVQELANNALKHAHARNLLVQVHISQEDNLLLLTVEDDGKGFDVSLLEKSGGMGWRSIRNRIESVKGKIDVNTGTGNGTSVLIEIPLS
jgi:two-component system NarL family sensor kinase